MPVARASSVTRTQAQASSTVTEVRARHGGALLEARRGPAASLSHGPGPVTRSEPVPMIIIEPSGPVLVLAHQQTGGLLCHIISVFPYYDTY